MFTGVDVGGLNQQAKDLYGVSTPLLDGPTLSLISVRFSTLNTLMVKGHSQTHARP